MEVHGLIALLAAVWLHEARAATLDLNLAACLLLDVLDIVATATNNLSSQIKSVDRFKVYRYFFLWPLALLLVSNVPARQREVAYPTKFVPLKVLWLATAETAFVYKVREILLHHLFNHLDSLVQAFLGGASDAQVEGRVLSNVSL